MSQENKVIFIVDGYSTARELVAELKRLSARCFHIRSVECPPAALGQSFDPSPYEADLGYIGLPNDAAHILKSHGPSAIVAGSEPGVEYAEELAQLMDMPSNDPKTTQARRNKQVMGERIAAAGLLCARQQLVTTEKEAIAWALEQGNWPIVIKPLDSAGSDGVTICRSVSEVKEAVSRALGKGNLLGLCNSALLAQTYLDGPQYLVNSVSQGGSHHITDAWEMRGREIPGFANAMEDWLLVDPRQSDSQQIFAYTLSALTALGFENGAAVSEVRFTSRGPALIETGARLNGPAMEREPYIAAGLKGTQATALAEMLVNSQGFSKRWSKDGYFYPTRAIAKSFFIFKNHGTILNLDGLNDLKKLKSWHAIYRPLSIGDKVSKTVSTVGQGGVVYWIGDDIETVLDDLRHFRALDDANNAYELEYDMI